MFDHIFTSLSRQNGRVYRLKCALLISMKFVISCDFRMLVLAFLNYLLVDLICVEIDIGIGISMCTCLFVFNFFQQYLIRNC